MMGGEGGDGVGGDPDPRDVALHGHPGDATHPGDESDPVWPGARRAAAGPELGRVASALACALTGNGDQAARLAHLRFAHAELGRALARLDPESSGPPWPVGTVLVPPGPEDPTVWVRGDTDADGWFEVDPRRRGEPYAWVFAPELPERPVVLRRGPDVAR